MSNTIQPISIVTGILDGAFTKVDHESNAVLTSSLGDIKRCVIGYSSREGVLGKLAGVIYRMWNAVKAVFGQSDWQRARRGLNTLVSKGIHHPVIDKIAKRATDYCPLIGGGDSGKAEQTISRFQAARGMLPAEFEASNKELDEGLEYLVKLNANRGLKNFLKNEEIKKVVGDGKSFVDVLVKLENILYSHAAEIFETLNSGDNSKCFLLLEQILEETCEIKELEHLAKPIIEVLPKLLEVLNGRDTSPEDVLPILMEIPELASIVQAVMANMSELKDVRKLIGF